MFLLIAKVYYLLSVLCMFIKDKKLDSRKRCQGCLMKEADVNLRN
jgi:hypothetical protein